MKGFLIALAATLALTHAAPQGGVEFTAREYQAFQQALGNRIPVAIQSAIRVLASEEINPTDFVVLNFNGLSGATSRTGAAATVDSGAISPTVDSGAISARTAPVTDDDVVDLFREVAGDAVEDVQDAAEDAADEADLDEEEAVNLTPVGLAEETSNEAPAVKGAEESPIAKSLVQNSLDNGAIDIVDPPIDTTVEAQADDDDAAVTTPGLAAETEDEEDVVVANEVARRKRQDDDNLNRNAQELGLALSVLGGFYGGHVGRYLDDIFGANVRLINNFQSTGNLVLDQVDRMLEMPKEKIKRSVSFFN